MQEKSFIMYYVIENGKEIIAFHREKRVVQKYCELLLQKYDDLKLSVNKEKNKKSYKRIEFDDLYLVRYKETFIQRKYIDTLELYDDGYTDDFITVKDILLRTVQTYDIGKKDLKSIRKVIMLMEDLAKDEGSYTPSLKDLKEMESDMNYYIYNTRFGR